MPETTMHTSPRLMPLLRERGFWAAAIVGLPLLVAGYVDVARAIVAAEPVDATSTILAFTANPIVVYLAARQIGPRTAVVREIGRERAARIAAGQQVALEQPAAGDRGAAA